MARKYEIITELYHRTQKNVTAPQAWQSFLHSACQNYRLSFDEQLLVYAQRPDATAVLEIERWNERFGRWVNRGATGIAVFDGEYTGRSRLKYYFDISDTHGSRFARPIPIWEVKTEYETDIIETLENSFGELADKSDLASALLSAAKNAVEDNMPDYLSELHSCKENSFLEELDNLNVEVLYKSVLQNSVGYMLLTRCGINPGDYFEDDDFRDALNFNTPETLNALGTATGDISQMCLSAISRTVLNLQRQNESPIRTFANTPENEYHNSRNETDNSERSFDDERNHIHETGRLQSAESVAAAGAGGKPWEVRITAPEVSERTPQSDIYQSSDLGQAERSSDGDRADSSFPNGADDGTNGAVRGRDGGTESQRPDEMGGLDEQHSSLGGGTDSERPDLQLTEDENAGASEKELPAFLDEKLIMTAIANKDDDLKYKKQQIELFFSVHADRIERAEYLQSAYQDRYTEILADGKRIGYKPQENGLLMWEGAYLSRKAESVFSWNIVVGWTEQLIDKKEYFINTDIKGLKNQNTQQMSLFDFASFDTVTPQGGSEQVSLFPHPQLSQQIIDETLCIGANDKHSRLIICAYFMKDKSLEENAQFLQQHYGTNGAGFYFNERKISIWYNSEGIRIAEGETANRSYATTVTWEQVAKRIRELLDLGRYMPQSELDKVADYERITLAANLLYITRDFTEEANAANYAPTIRLALSEKGGFPEIEKKVSTLLSDSQMLRRITDEWNEFVTAYEKNPDLLRFRFYRPKELLQKLTDLQREPLTFTVAEDYNPQRRFFISTDEIDKLLRGGKNNTDYRLAVYAFYHNHTDRSEREKFLKDYHGEYSGSSSGNDDITYQKGKGVSFSHGSISEPYAKVELKWNQVEKRVHSLISSDKFLSEDDRAAMPEYERKQLARLIRSFFYNVPDEHPRPYASNDISDYWEGVDEVAKQLTDSAQVQNIYENMMLPVWESTTQDARHYDSRKAGIEAMREYLDGTYSVFNEKKSLEPLQEFPALEEQTQRQEIADYLEESGYVVSEELVDVGISEYAAHGGKGDNQDIADYIEDEILSDEGEPDLSDIEETAEPSEKLPAQKEQVLAPPKPKRERVVFTTLHPEVPAEQRHNFRITDTRLGYGTPGEKFTANTAAIRCLKQIEYENRLATPEEQITLSRYVGWGGLSDCFDDRNSHYGELKNLLSEDEYAAARQSSLTAFYTSPVIIEGMYQALSQMGFRTGTVLEPSCGIGNFIGSLPQEMAQSKVYGVEIDSISGRIAQQLYQNSSISVNGFEKVQMPDSFFDIAIGNVPFGDLRVLDKQYDKHHWLIHDYFFGKTLDKVRPGGIVAFISSKGTMDKDSSAVRRYLAQRADLIGAIRLPNNAFKQNAGTEVTSDIIFLQKRDRMTDIEPDWVHLDTDENGIKMNSYFVQHPDMVLGEMVMESTRFGMDSTCKAYENTDLSEQLREAVSNLHAEITAYEIEQSDEEEDLSIPADPAVRNFSYTVQDGKLYFRENSRMHPVNASVTAESRIRGMIVLRDCVRRLIEVQTESYPDEDIKEEQLRLNTLYDDYTKKYGLLCSRGNSLAFGEDASYCLLCSLEVLDGEGNFKHKADIFTKRTISPHIPVTSVDTASEALAVSISEKARVDMDYMAELSGKTTQALENELKGVIFRDVRCAETAADVPTSFADLTRFPFVTADEYLSGNVRRKLRMAQALYEALPTDQKGQVAQNVSALEAVQPVDLTAGEIGVRIGVNWVPIDIYQQFMYELFGTSGYARSRINILNSKCTGEWNITNKSADSGNIRAITTYGTKRINAYHILEQTLNQKDVRIFDTIVDANGDEKRVLNKKETAIAQDRQELIKAKFSEWIWKDIDRREKLCKIYNETFNAIRPREYDGQHIRFSGMNPEIVLREHQINAIAHIMYGGNTLLAHEVGAGKTFEMVAAAMESKRLGLCSKSLIVVPNHITEQWAAEWLQLYPASNILVATKKDFETQNRKKFCGRIATGDYDAIIIGHSQFEKIPMSKERQEIIIQRQIDDVMFGISEAKSAKAERYTIKQLEKMKRGLEIRLAKLNDQSRKDSVVTFEELGVDRIFIDESHYFKNLFLMTKMRNVGGIAQTEAQKSSDLFMKCQYLDEITGGRGTIFATGTPIPTPYKRFTFDFTPTGSSCFSSGIFL
jgi:N12 class adenine-specific DNA methylase